MKKTFVRLISAVLSAAMTLTAVPLSAFAEGETHTHDGESNVITTPLDFREKTADENGVGWSWDYDTKTLMLDGVNIQATTDSMSVVTVPDGTEIVLNGNNTIVQTDTGDSYTYVLSAVNNQEVNCDGTMTISGEGVLNAENRSTDSMARSLGGTIILNGGTVNATGKVVAESLEIHNDGALNAEASAVSNDGAAVGVKRGITVDGNGSLTAVGGAVENEYANNGAILLNSNFGDKISVSGNGSITVPEGNAAKVGIYYDGNKSIDAEISGGKVTAYGTKCGIYKVNLIMSGTGSVYATGGTYGIGQTVPTIDEDEFVVKGSTEFKAEESSVTANAEFNSGYYEIGGADAKTVVIKPDTSPRIILGKQTGIFKTEEYKIIEDIDMTDIKLKGTVYFDITLKNMSDEEFADARGCFGGDEPDLLASIIKTDYGWVCMVCDTEFSVTYDTDNTLTIKCGDIVSNTVQVKSNANRFNKVTQGDNTNRTVFYTNTSQEEKDNYKLVSTYTVDSESISYNWYSTNSAYSVDELGAAVSGTGGEFKLADNIPAGNYVLYCDITYSDGDSTETVTEKFTFTYKECAHENGYSDGKCTNCGALCDHSDIDIDTGKCNECERQFVATISTDGSAPTGYDTLADCLDSITADTGNYVKIYQDIGDASATATLDTIDVNHNVMIDLNGHKLNNIKLGVNKDVKLALTGTAGSYVTQVYVRKGGGSFIIDSEANVEFNTIFVEDSARLAVNDGAKVTTEQLTVIASVNDDGTTTTSVKLATGMKLGGLTYHRQNNSGALKLGNLLDVTRQALRYDESGEYLDLYKEYGSMGYSVALTVVEHTDADHKYGSGTGKCEECGKPCEHGGDINTDTGICSICGAVVSVAIYTDANGISKYVDTDELHSLLNEYNGSGTIKLFKDYSKPSAQYDLYGELTIDLNGRQFKIRSITPCKNGKLTIKNSGNPVMLGCNVYPTNDASYAGGTLIIDGDVVLDTSIYVYDSSTVILKAGAYQAGLYARDSKTLYDMLGEGKAFFKTDGTLFNANVKEISSSETLTIKDHSHTYVDGECGCGYVCPHSDVNSETGKCNECEYQYAAVIVKDGAAASVYEETEMEAAFEAADSDANTGCTLRVYKNYTGSYKTLSGKFTLWIAEKANVGTLTVSGDITVTGSKKNNSFYGDFDVEDGGKLTFDENCGAKGTVLVGAGIFDCYYSLGTTLNINDASSNVILHGGTFQKICYNGGGDRANAEILTLLAENRMFMWRSGGPIDGSKTLLKDGFATTVIVIPHEGHSYDSTTGKCTICGKRCGHTDVDSKTGMCKTCQYEFVATLTVGDKVTGFDSLSDCLSKTSEDSENYVKIYKNIDDITTINVNHTVTVDLNSHKLYYIELKVNNDNGAGNLTLTGSEDSYISQVDVCGGRTFKIDSDANINFETIFVEAGARFEVSYGANVTVNTLVVKESLKLYGRTTTSVRLATGMRIGALMYELDRNSGSGNLLLYSLLGEGKALQYDNSGEYVDIYEKFTSKTIHDSFTVVDHYEHSYDKATGKCVCGYVCPHSDVDSKTGVCSICKYQFTAGVSGVGTAKYFDNIDDAFTAALSAENNGCTLTLYKHCEITQSVEIGNTTVTVDVNGCSLGGEADISVNNGGVLYLKDSRKSTYYGCIDAPFSVNGGTLINGTADGGSSAADVLNLVINSAKCVEIYGGIFENVYIAHASGVALYGGRYNTICGEESNTPVNALLAKGYAFAILNSVTHLPESIVDGSEKTIGENLTNVMVVAHTHTYTETNAKCACGVCALAIFTETTQSSETYTFIESATQFKNIAENEADGVLKLTGDVDCIVKGIIINGNKTIDMNGHTLNVSVGTEEISAVAVYGNVTFENSGSSRAVINATGVYSYGMVTVNGDIEFDTFATFEDGDALINAGVFKNIYVQGRSVIEILGSGKALASESGEILNASVQQIYKAGDNIFVKAHPKHTYDDHGNCACGYKCLHDGEGQVNEDSANKVCSECGAKIYAKVTTADGKVKYFDDITEGLRYADKAENKGCVFTLVTTGGLENDITLSSGQFTITAIDDNYINAYTRKINIKGAEITVENCAFNCFVGLYSGSLTYPEGSTSVCINGISVFGGTLNISDGVSENFGANKFTISDTATDAKVTIGGGIYSEIKLGQYTFKDILASGTRLISVEYSQETDEIIATNELLYSIVSEQNTLGVDDDKDYRFVKCDHKNEDGSYAFNDGVCKYCNSEFAASVSYTVDGSAKTELFGDIYDAFDKANEIGTATITLYKDITDSEGTRDVTVTGNVTIALNGKTLGGRYGIARIPVSDGGTLTVNGDGDMDTPIYVNENSKLVINGGGYFNSVSVKKGGNAEIGGGTIRVLSVRGNAKLSGGKFNDIEILNGNLESVLADGYGYKVEGGTWLSIAERAENVYISSNNDNKPVSVEEAPIKSASIAWVGEEAPVIYRNGEKYLYVNITYELAVGSRGATYSDFVNGNNRIKDYNLYNKYMVHCYEIGKLAAKDGEVEYYIVLKCNGYEYKSNVLKLTLATCSHPEDSFSYENDGFVICGICDALIEAEVVDADGKSLGYADIESAIKLAQENEGSTVKLMSEGISESITVTGGRFTVDFNGKKVFYQFDVNGGDVTFTSSVKQADVETLISGITVNGTDAEVTIDGKIKLGKVRIISSTLTVNSTDGYIGELSIEGGNAVIDGAEIDTLVFKGGDLAIRNVTVGSLDINKKATDATEHNIVIESGSFDTITCSDDSDYNIVKALASERRLRGTESGIIYEYSEIESLTEATDITVEKCDHKYANGNIAVDDDYVCYYCNSQIVATVSYTAGGSETTDLFSDIYDAFERANEIGTATVTLQKNITDDITDTIAVTGNVTLELNGKKLSQPGTDVWYSIEVTSGKLTVNGSGLIKRVAVCNGSNAEINGGTFSDFIIKDGGNAVIKGGQFYSLQVSGEGRNVGQLLADGYAYWSFIDSGIWSTIAEREKQDIANVEVKEAPIKSASIAWYGGGTPVIYRNGAKNLDVNITYELADASKQITYSDYVNGNNRSKDSEFSDNWYTVFGYEIGDIITEDGEVEYYTVLKCDGYEYKSNVLKLTLATCSHPENSFTEKNNDGGVFCGICDLLIGAQVIKADGEPLGYADIESAIKLAQENEGSTVKLISEGVSTSNTSITVTGGKFTVDFNGKEVYYNFDVKGGDVTFTSSTEQADAKNLLSTIKVNGADAKVTIDGKIKLGMVRTFSGTLTVNSTDGYIGELSIEGAKTDVDGARIGALRTFGGEAVIKNVTADSLAMFDNRSGGSEYNISIVSGRFGSFTCENGSNYTLGRAIASGSAVSADSMNGITVYTYEAIQTMTSTYRIFVDKCNHKDKNGSYVLDGNPCPYCNEEIVATVSYTANGGEETDLFSDIYDAFAKANEIGTATVTLYKDITDDITDTIAVTGNVTLELNGKKLSQPGTDVWYSIEVTSGKLTVNGSGLIKRVAVCNGSNAEINGGTFSDFIIKDGGNAVIKGGQFYSLQVSGEGRNVGQLLADGYAYWSFIDSGIWSTIAEREKQDIANVEVKEAPIKSATITANDESPIIYRNGRKASTFAADVTYSGDKTLYITGCLIDGTVISEKTELLNGYCYLLGDQVDKVVAEDGEIQYYCIFTYDGYDYKSNAVTLTVATCQHPVESVKCDDDGNYVCGICNITLAASVELSDGTLSYYDNWNDAIGAAQENEGCTLKLLNYSLVNNNETFDISKGRFTVDLNKNDGTTTFAFDVKGGDITFTAPQKASSSLTGVTVSGENANVLIDSKATLNYLVVNSGKVSADGANIGAITINGGDTVINDVNADYLSMKADTTGGSGYNVSIVSGTFNIFTCENESNYTLGRAIASGSRVIGLNAIVGSGFKYAEIQSMTKANYLNVIKCDHKDENDSYALDGNLCPYCNEEIAATVSYTADGSEQTDLFSDIYDAFDKANEAGTATITLYKDIENSEFTRYITVTGNVTLALNGKKLGYSFVSLTVEVSDGGMLTVDGDGKMMVPIIVNENAKLTVNGGEIATVMIYKDGDAVIGGGFIEDLVVNGNAKLSGGKFFNLEIANGSLESLLADGYAYKVDGGAWLSIAERAKEKYYSWNNEDKPVTVEEAPIKSATLSTEINKLYRNSNANPTLKFNLALAHGSNLNDSYVSKRYGINSYVSGDIIYSSLSALVNDAKLSADEIIDKAGDSDVAEIYFVVTTGDGYEIKSNTVSIDLVDCDHSQVVDPTADKETAGNITEPTYCEICESKFNAKITKGDDVRYYNNLDEAAKDAQKSENEGCTLYPLYNKNGYGGQFVITEGNFTLKYAVRTAFSRPIIINGKAKLTVTGRCAVTAFENQDAFIVRGGDVTFDGLATGSNVTINGGNVTMAANNINCLTIHGGNVSISSGGFAEIVTTVSDKVIADYIDPGFWVQDRGTKEWIDIYSLDKATASSTNVLSVRLCPMQIIKPIDTVYYTNGYYPDGIPSLQINAEPWYSNEVNAKVAYQWIAIDENGNETEIEGATDRKLSLENLTTGRYYCRLTYSNAATAGVSMKSDVVTATITECEHSGGKATCTNKAKCEICGAEYGEMLPHSYAHIKAPEYLKSAATCTAKAVYYTSCADCGQSSKGTADEETFEYGNALGHKYGEWVSNGDGTHTRVCANDSTHTETKACHGGKATCTAKAICEVCGKAYGEMTAHTFTKTVSEKYLKSAATCTAKAVYYTSCTECGQSSKGTKNEATFEYGNALGHKYGEWISNGDGTHTRVCANDSKHTETKACHGGKATCTAKAICEDCGKAYGEMTAHTFTKTASEKYLKSAATCTAKAVYYTSCADCGQSSKGTADEETFEYGNALGHKYGEWVSNGDGTHTRVCANDNKHTETKACHGGKATCTAKAICEDCGAEYGEMTAHTFTAKSAVSRYLKKAATCTEKSVYYVSCSGCGLSSKGTASEATFEGSALGHLLTQWNVTDASCTENGSEERHCTRCDYKQTHIIPAKGHTFGEWKITKNVGCVTDGEQTRECTVCGSKETKVIAATGVHIYGEWKVTKAPTCTAAGVKERTCTGCNAKETMTLQATGHKYIASTVKPTYSAKGYTLYKCSLCGKSYKSNYTNMLVLPSVSGLKATSKTDKSITLGWNKNANAAGYVIEYYNGAKWVKKSTVTKNTTVKYTVSSLKPGTVNKFRIRAYNATNYSAYSYITVNTLPSAVSGFKTVSKTSSTSTLSWNKNTSADGYIIDRYIGNRWMQTLKVVGSGNVSATVKNLTAGSTNKLRIRAYKTINKKTEYSSYTYLNVKTKPAQMTGLKVKSKTNNTVTLQWNKNTTADSVFIEKYDGSKWVNVKKLSAGYTAYTVQGLSSGRTYRFRVRAYRAGEYSGYTYLNVNTRPYTTTGMKSKSVTKNSIVLQWNKNTSADGYSIEKYDGKKWVQVKRYTSNKSTTYTIKSLKAGTTYKFRMRAYKTIGKVNEYSAYTYCNVTTAK